MNDTPKRLSKELLHKFVAGKLDDAENETIMARLAEDEASLEFVDALWNEQELPTAVFQLPTLKPEQAQRLRRQLLHQIHRAELTMTMVKMGTQGFGRVAVGLLRPFLGKKNRNRRNSWRPKHND